jgi:hypothetical protein
MFDIERIKQGPFTICIFQDDDAESPREWCNTGKMVLFGDRRYTGHNEGDFPSWAMDFEGSMRCLASRAGTGLDDDDVPMEHVFRCVRKHFVCVAVHRRQDGDTFGNGEVDDTDDGCDGIIYIPVKDLPKECIDRDQALSNLESEISLFGQWVTGDTYGFVIEDEHGDNVESCCGFFGLDECIREAKDQASRIRHESEVA